jgi:hypothetical protein
MASHTLISIEFPVCDVPHKDRSCCEMAALSVRETHSAGTARVSLCPVRGAATNGCVGEPRAGWCPQPAAVLLRRFTVFAGGGLTHQDAL